MASLLLSAAAIGRFPWGTMYEFISVTCALSIAAGLVFLRKPALQVTWPFVLIPVLAFMTDPRRLRLEPLRLESIAESKVLRLA